MNIEWVILICAGERMRIIHGIRTRDGIQSQRRSVSGKRKPCVTTIDFQLWRSHSFPFLILNYVRLQTFYGCRRLRQHLRRRRRGLSGDCGERSGRRIGVGETSGVRRQDCFVDVPGRQGTGRSAEMVRRQRHPAVRRQP